MLLDSMLRPHMRQVGKEPAKLKTHAGQAGGHEFAAFRSSPASPRHVCPLKLCLRGSHRTPLAYLAHLLVVIAECYTLKEPFIEIQTTIGPCACAFECSSAQTCARA